MLVSERISDTHKTCVHILTEETLAHGHTVCLHRVCCWVVKLLCDENLPLLHEGRVCSFGGGGGGGGGNSVCAHTVCMCGIFLSAVAAEALSIKRGHVAVWKQSGREGKGEVCT